MPHKVYAFDRGGVLHHVREMRDLARILLDQGHEVHCITAVTDEQSKSKQHQDKVRKSLERQMGDRHSLTGVHFVGYDHYADEPQGYNAGLKKAAVMKEIGATVLFDDNPHVCRAVRDSGLQALQVWKES